MVNEIKLAFDVGETKIYERVGKSDSFVAHLSISEAKMLHSQLGRKIEEME